jgi:tripartite-type tricarboxylate transporter receptor subunit TctC
MVFMKWFFVFLGAILLNENAIAQAYPSKPVRLIISFTPGSSTDIVARIVMQKVSEYWAQPAVIENRAGAGGSIGSNVVATAAPDGYTLLVNSSAHAVNPAIFAKLPYDTVKDFTDIAALAVQPNVLVVAAGSPYKTLADLVNAARAKPGSINFGHAGIGSGTHLNTERFISAAGISVTQVPFKGTPEVIAALLSNSVDCYWSPISAGMSAIKGGKLRALAVSSARRNPTLPDVPTTGEAGVNGADSPLWFGGPAAGRRAEDLGRRAQGAGGPGREGKAACARQRWHGHVARRVREVRARGDRRLPESRQGCGHQAAVKALS